MPAKNSVKQYLENGYYHLYNRGVEKREIFMDQQDYAVFLYYLKKYIDPVLGSDPIWKYKSLSSEIELLAFCLMPNHFHLLVKQTTKKGIMKLMRAVCTNYVMYFNQKYSRVGTLFQGKYKACLVLEEDYLLHLSRYIHLNPSGGSDPKVYAYSSLGHYLGTKKSTWIKPQEILNFFKSARKMSLPDTLSYESFIDDYRIESEELLGDLILD